MSYRLWEETAVAVEADLAVEPETKADDEDPPEDLLTEPQVRSRFAIGRRALAKLVDAGELRAWRVAGRRKYSPGDIEALLARSQVTPPPPAAPAVSTPSGRAG